jgi:hypothetical protein
MNARVYISVASQHSFAEFLVRRSLRDFPLCVCEGPSAPHSEPVAEWTGVGSSVYRLTSLKVAKGRDWKQMPIPRVDPDK